MLEQDISGMLSIKPNHEVSLPEDAFGAPMIEGRVLIVERDPMRRRRLNDALDELGFDVSEARSEGEAIAVCRVIPYEAVIVGEREPPGSSVETCAALRQILPRAEIMVLSPRGDSEHRIEVLEAGANEFLTQPSDIKELAARLRNALRRASAPVAPPEQPIQIGEVLLDPGKRLVLKAGREIRLTPKEFGLLAYLMENVGRPKTHAQILRAVWGPGQIENVEYLRTFVRQLRKKMEDNPKKPRHLLTDSHFGYRFAAQREPAPRV